jgi:hypothetical protein
MRGREGGGEEDVFAQESCPLTVANWRESLVSIRSKTQKCKSIFFFDTIRNELKLNFNLPPQGLAKNMMMR